MSFNPKLVQLQAIHSDGRMDSWERFQSQTGSITRALNDLGFAVTIEFQSQTGSITR